MRFALGLKYLLPDQVRHSPTVGRYLVAARDIEPLELVLWDRWVGGSDRSSLHNRICHYRSNSSNFLKSYPSQGHNLIYLINIRVIQNYIQISEQQPLVWNALLSLNDHDDYNHYRQDHSKFNFRAAAVGPGADTLPVCLECFKRVEAREGGRWSSPSSSSSPGSSRPSAGWA